MYCDQCGTQMEDGAAFCPQCGAAQGAAAQQTWEINNRNIPEEHAEEENLLPVKKEKKKLPVGAVVGIAVAALAVIAAVIFLPGKGKNPDGREGDSDISSENEEDETPLYHIEDVASVDIKAQNYTPGTKQPGMEWDSSLFYRLEDVDTTSPDDGYIANCKLTKTLLRNARSGDLIQYEIYSSPDDGTIYKIVSIEAGENGLGLADYYYQDGLPNFMFTREDTVYTPTYATIEKVGERYYFNNDVMVRWRMIRTPGEVGEYTLAPGDVWYSQADYFAESDEIRGIYDETELRALNAAHNTYDAVTEGESIGMVQGFLRDVTGNGIAGKKVNVRRTSDDALLYQAVTGENGEYSFFVYLDDTDCYLKVAADETYKETTVQGVRFSPSSVTYTYGLTMHKNSGDEYPVALRLYSCMDVVSDENGTATGEAIRTASAIIREGAGNYDGDSLITVETENGELTAALPSGIYTVQFHTEGYLDSYTEVEVMEGSLSTDVYVMPAIAENQTGVVLTWDSEDVDLDLTLFTPDQAENGDMAHIGGGVNGDGKGNLLVADNSSRCEVMFINSDIQGSYKLYVNNYTDSVAGSYASDTLYKVNVHVYIYNSDGFVAEYTLPVGQNGVVWEVVEINGRNVTPAQRVYSEISGKRWWTADKSLWLEEEDTRLKEALDNRESDLRELLFVLNDGYASGNNIKALLRGEQAGIEEFFGLDGESMAPAMSLSYVGENQPDNISELNKKVSGDMFLTEEQAEYLLYSVCGKQIDYDFSGYDNWIAPYIGLGYSLESGGWEELENFSVERVGANEWKVRAYSVSYYINYASQQEFERIAVSARVCFTIVRNPDSCFDGYSLTGFEVEEEADFAGWAKIYYDYLTTDPEGIAIIENNYGLGWQGDYCYNLIYVDDDMIPEIYLRGRYYASGDLLLSISDGKVADQYFNECGGNYIPYTGLLRDEGVHMGYAWDNNYKLENGNIREIGGWDGHFSDTDPETGALIEMEPDNIVLIIDRYDLYGTEVTKQQYEETINSYTGGAEFQPCIQDYATSSESLLDCLRQLKNGY